MFRKTFNVVLVIFLVVFTAAWVVFLLSGLITLLKPANTSGIFMVAGGVSNRVFSIFLALVLSLLVVGVFLITRRIKSR